MSSSKSVKSSDFEAELTRLGFRHEHFVLIRSPYQ